MDQPGDLLCVEEERPQTLFETRGTWNEWKEVLRVEEERREACPNHFGAKTEMPDETDIMPAG